MPKVKIELPEQFTFTTTIPVRITDVNYGNHVGNDAVLSIIHEARLQYLLHYGYSEMNVGGNGIIMADVAIEFKQEMFYGDVILASITAGEFGTAGFRLFYKLEKETDSGRKLLVAASSGMVCFNYDKKKIAPLPEEVKQKLSL